MVNNSFNNPFESSARRMTRRERSIRGKWLSVSSFLLLLIVWALVEMNNKNLKIQRLEKEKLQTAAVNHKYELSLNYLTRSNPKVAKDFRCFLNHPIKEF